MSHLASVLKYICCLAKPVQAPAVLYAGTVCVMCVAMRVTNRVCQIAVLGCILQPRKVFLITKAVAQKRIENIKLNANVQTAVYQNVCTAPHIHHAMPGIIKVAVRVMRVKKERINRPPGPRHLVHRVRRPARPRQPVQPVHRTVIFRRGQPVQTAQARINIRQIVIGNNKTAKWRFYFTF